MQHAVHVFRGSPYTCLGKEGTRSLIPLSKSISDDIRGSDGSIYADEAFFGAPPLSFVCVLIFCFFVYMPVLCDRRPTQRAQELPNESLQPRPVCITIGWHDALGYKHGGE